MLGRSPWYRSSVERSSFGKAVEFVKMTLVPRVETPARSLSLVLSLPFSMSLHVWAQGSERAFWRAADGIGVAGHCCRRCFTGDLRLAVAVPAGAELSDLLVPGDPSLSESALP